MELILEHESPPQRPPLWDAVHVVDVAADGTRSISDGAIYGVDGVGDAVWHRCKPLVAEQFILKEATYDGASAQIVEPTHFSCVDGRATPSHVLHRAFEVSPHLSGEETTH